MADIAIPDPVVVALKLHWNCRVRSVSGGIFCMGAVMTCLAINPVVHVASWRILQYRVAEEGVGIFRICSAMTASALRLFKPRLTACKNTVCHPVHVSMAVGAGLACSEHDTP